GGTIAIVPKSNVREICRCIQNYKISYAHFIPQTIHKLAEDPIVKNYDISSLRIKAEKHITIDSDVFNVIQLSVFTSYTPVIRSSYKSNSGNDTDFIEVIKEDTIDNKLDPRIQTRRTFASHPTVADAAVIGQNLIEHQTAYVAIKPEHKKTPELKYETQKYIKDIAAPHKELKCGVYFTNQIPKTKTSLRKILKILREKPEKSASKNIIFQTLALKLFDWT
ncbi:1926_t:CDS:2, partial [Gigaspora rosea]